MARARSTQVRPPSSALDGLVREGEGVLLLGLEHVGDDAWAVLSGSGLRLVPVLDTAAAVEAIAEGAAQIVVTDTHHGLPLIDSVRARSTAARATATGPWSS